MHITESGDYVYKNLNEQEKGFLFKKQDSSPTMQTQKNYNYCGTPCQCKFQVNLKLIIATNKNSLKSINKTLMMPRYINQTIYK